MTVKQIKEMLKRTAIVFETGGKRPTGELLESWIGSVCWQQDGEKIPKDRSGSNMIPIAAIFLKDLPYLPLELSGIELVTIFMSNNIWDNLISDDLSPWFCIRTYHSLEQLVPCKYQTDMIKSFPLIPQLVENDYPCWDGGGIPEEIEDIILQLETTEGIDYFDDICEEIYAQHKVGGYPAFCQSGYSFGHGYEFVMQISSDVKALLHIVDSGKFYFFYNHLKSDWKVYCDFY
jgi:hypothetical protein